MKQYTFDYRDNKGHLHTSEQYNSIEEAKIEISRLRKQNGSNFSVVDSWVRKNGTYVGSFYYNH